MSSPIITFLHSSRMWQTSGNCYRSLLADPARRSEMLQTTTGSVPTPQQGAKVHELSLAIHRRSAGFKRFNGSMWFVVIAGLAAISIWPVLKKQIGEATFDEWTWHGLKLAIIGMVAGARIYTVKQKQKQTQLEDVLGETCTRRESKEDKMTRLEHVNLPEADARTIREQGRSIADAWTNRGSADEGLAVAKTLAGRDPQTDILFAILLKVIAIKLGSYRWVVRFCIAVAIFFAGVLLAYWGQVLIIPGSEPWSTEGAVITAVFGAASYLGVRVAKQYLGKRDAIHTALGEAQHFLQKPADMRLEQLRADLRRIDSGLEQ